MGSIGSATDNRFDLIVVGSGFAGSATALSFLETCKDQKKQGRVLIVESGKDGERCGASRWTSAYLRLDKDNNLDPAWVDEMDRVSQGLHDKAYCAKMYEEVPKTMKYLLERGVEITHHKEKNVLLELDTDQYYATPVGGGYAIVQNYFAKMQQLDGYNIMWETQAEKLITNDDGEVAGVKVRGTDGRLRSVHAPVVMLACGGFEGNQEMLAKYVGPRTQSLPLIAPGLVHNRGAGLQMALEVGAATAGAFDGIHSELVDTRSKKPDAVVWGHSYGIMVNEDCKRFYDEGKRHLFATFEMVALETWRDQNNKSYLIFDKPVSDKFRPGWVYQTTEVDPEEGQTIAELAGKLGIDPKKLGQTVDEYNAACNDKPWDTMKFDGKATTGLSPNKSNWANPIATPPFYGFPLTTTLTFTYGGLKTDLESRVLATNNVPIPGLYAAGELTGAFYHEYPPMTTVLRSLTFGRVAGTAIAKQLGTDAKFGKTELRSTANKEDVPALDKALGISRK